MDIMKFFQTDPNDNTSQETDFLQRLVELDERLMSKHNEFNYSLETDTSFDNCEKEKDQKNYSNNMFDFFDRSLSQDRFTNIISDQVDILGKFNYEGIKPAQSLLVMRNADSVGKLYLRLSLKHSCSKDSFETILNLLADSSIQIIMGGTSCYNIPKLLLVYLICSELGTNIEYLDAQTFNSKYSKEEIKSMIKTERPEGSICTNKYYFESENSRYLDIPLLDNFLTYNMPIPLLAMQFHDVRIEFNIPSQTIVDELNKYIDSIHIIAGSFNYLSAEYRRQSAQKSYELVKMNFSMDYFHSHTSQRVSSEHYEHFAKFMFVFIRPSVPNPDITKTDLPAIESVEIQIYNSGSYTIEQTNMYLAEYNNIYVYGIALDGHSNMKNWVGILNECNGLFESLANAGPNKPITNLKTWVETQPFKCVAMDGYKINLTNYSIPVNIEVFVGNQNIQRVMSGMTGEAFSH